jgi:hypothetical protein
MTKKYWCPTCGDMPFVDFLGLERVIIHNVETCTATAIPVVEPLDVPEVTTWGESGGAEAVTCMVLPLDGLPIGPYSGPTMNKPTNEELAAVRAQARADAMAMNRKIRAARAARV